MEPPEEETHEKEAETENSSRENDVQPDGSQRIEEGREIGLADLPPAEPRLVRANVRSEQEGVSLSGQIAKLLQNAHLLGQDFQLRPEVQSQLDQNLESLLRSSMAPEVSLSRVQQSQLRGETEALRGAAADLRRLCEGAE